jgi:YD repeat-containing protein
VLTQADPLGNCTGFVYDSTHNLFVIEARDPLFFAPGTCNPAGGDARHKTTATWDFVCALPTETRDLNGQPTTTQYDALCRPRRVTTVSGAFACTAYLDLGAWSYVYDAAGRLTEQTDAKGQVTRLAYDGLGRVLTKTAKYGTPQAELTTFAYDQARAGFFNVGRQTAAANAAATIEYNFDQEGRQVARTYTLSGVTP